MSHPLLALADHDELIVRARHDVEHPPSRGELDAASRELDALTAEARSVLADRAPLAASAETLEREATTARERATAIAHRLDSSTGAGRELEAMAHERDALYARADRDDDELLGLYELLEPLDERLGLLRAAAAAAASRRERAQASNDEERDAASARLVELERARAGLTAALDPSTLVRYEAAAARAGGIGAARLVDGRCGGCRVAVPAAVADRLLHGEEGLIEVCDECGRLLTR